MNRLILILFSFFLFFTTMGWSLQSSARIESETNLVPSTESRIKENEETENNKPDPIPVPPPSGKIPSTLIRLSENDLFSSYAFLVDKSTRTLSIWKFQENQINLVSYYPSDMGRQNGNKKSLGDLKTPEGIYFFQNRYEGKQLDFNEYGSRAFTTDYPNFFDQLSSKTGSGIWLHAIPQKKSLQRGSRGCVVVRDEVIQKVSDFITLKHTPIVIQEKVNYVEPQERLHHFSQLSEWLDGWKKNWETKNIEKYISYYGDEFKSLGMNRSSWRKYKEQLNDRYQSITVQAEDPMIVVNDHEAVIKFIQTYRSDQKSDHGEKTLYLRKNPQGEFRIIGEQWIEIPKRITANETKRPKDGDNL